MGCTTMLPVVGTLSILVVCTLLASMAEGSGFLNWAFDGQQQSPANSSTTNPLVFTAQATSAFSDIVVVVARINVTDNGTQPVTLGGANHPFGLDESGNVVSYAAYKFNSLYYGESLITNSSAYPQAPLTTPWNSVTILHYVATASDPTVMDRLCFTSQTNLPSTIYCGILLAVTADVVPGPSQSTVPVEGVTPFVWVQNPIPRRAFTNSPDVVNAPYIPLVPTVDANNKALEGVVPWKCGRIVSDSGAGGSSTDCTIRSPEENTPMHRGCNPPLGTSMNTHVSTTVALTWNETVYLFRPLEFAVRTLSCLDPDVDTPPSQCYNYSDLIYIVPKDAAWGFLQMTYPQSAKLPPWIFLDATPLVTSQCLLYVSRDHSPGGIVLYDLATPFNGSATFLPVGILTPPDGPPNRTCTPSITTALVDMIYSVNVTGQFAELGVGLTDGLFTTASTLFVTLCGGSADFYVVSPTVAYMQQAPASAAGPFVLQHAGMVTVPYPEGFAGADSPNAFAVSATRHGTLSRVKEGAYISKTAYNTLATSCMYTIALAVPSTGYRGASAWAKANNKTYGAELDSYVSVVTAMSSYVLGFEATVGGVGGGDILGDGFSLTHTVVQSTFYSILDAHRTDTTTVLLDPKDYYASLNATKEFCQYGPCEVAVPVRDRITAVIGFSQLQQLPPVAQNELLSAEVVMKAVCGGDLPYEAQSTSALIAIHREMVNATASWLLREATSVSVLTLMVSVSMNVSDGSAMGNKEASVYSTRMDGNMSAAAEIPPGTLSIYGGTSFIQPTVMVSPYDGLIGDVSARGGGASDIWLVDPLNPQTLERIYHDQLGAGDLFPVRIPTLSSQAVASEMLYPLTGTASDYLHPQVVLSVFTHNMRMLATLPRTTFYPTASGGGTVGDDLPALSTCLYQLSDNGAPSITSQGTSLNTFLSNANSSRSSFYARWLYDDTYKFAICHNYVLNQASYIQLQLGNIRYGTHRFNTQVVLALSLPADSMPSCSEWVFSVSVSYGFLSVDTVMEGGITVRSGIIVDENLDVSVNQTFLATFASVTGAVGVTQNYCSRAPLPGGFSNTTSLKLATQAGATATGILYSQQLVATSVSANGAPFTFTAGSLKVAYSAAAVVGSASFPLLQPFGNLSYPSQWTASDRHASRVSGGNVTSTSVPFGSDGSVFICQGTTVMLVNPISGRSASYDISLGVNDSDASIPCPPTKATCTCIPSSVQTSADATVVFVSFVYIEHFNASSIYPSTLEETLVVFFNCTDGSMLGWVAPPAIRQQMGGLCPTAAYSIAPFVAPQVVELPLATLQTTVAQVRAAQSEYLSDNSSTAGDTVIAGLVAAIPGTRCLVVWIATTMSQNRGTPNVGSTVRTFVFASVSHLGAVFTGVVAAFSGLPFLTISLSSSTAAAFNCGYCAPETLLSVPLVNVVEAIVSGYDTISDESGTLSHRYDYPVAIVPGVVNTSVLYFLTAGEFRIVIQGFPAQGEFLGVNGCTLNTSVPCAANYSKMVALVSNLYSDGTAPPLYEIDLVACHTVPKYPNTTWNLLGLLPADGTCRLLHNETRRNVILTDPWQSISAYQFLGDYACVTYGTAVCFRLAPLPSVTSVALAGRFNILTFDYTLDLFYGAPVTSFSGMVAVFNLLGHLPMTLSYPTPDTLPYFASLQPNQNGGSYLGTNFSDCGSLAISDSILTMLCAVVGDPSTRHVAVVEAASLSVLASGGPYVRAGSAPVISNDGTYLIFVDHMLTLTVTLLNVQICTRSLTLTSTVCGVVDDASYAIKFKSNDFGSYGLANVAVTSLQPNIPVARRSLGQAISATSMYFFTSNIGVEFSVDQDDAAALFTDLLPNGGSTDMYSYIMQITDTVTLIQQARQSTITLTAQQRQPTDVGSLQLDGEYHYYQNASLSSATVTTAVPSYKFTSGGCYACIVVDAFSASARTGQCPSVCTVDIADGSQLRYTAHNGGMLRQTKPSGSTTFSAVGAAGSSDIAFTELHDPNSTLVNAHYVYRLRASQDVVPCAEGASSTSALLSSKQSYCADLLGEVSKYRDVVSVDVVPDGGLVVVARRLAMSDTDGTGLVTTLQYVSKRPAYTVESHVSFMHPLAMAIGIQAVPIVSTDPFSTIQSATIASGSLSIVVGGVERELSNCSSGSLEASLLGPPSSSVCDTSTPPVGVIGGVGDLPLPSDRYLSVEWRSGGTASLWGSGFVRTRHPLPLTYLLHRVPSMSDSERNMQTPTFDVLYTSISAVGVGSQWSPQDAASCQALPPGVPSYDSNTSAGGMTFNWDGAMPPPVVCPSRCTPDYASCGSLVTHFLDSYLFHSTRITGQPYVLPVGPLSQACWDAVPDVSRLQSAVGYFQQLDLPSDWAYGRVAQVELYCTASGQVAVTATVPDLSETGAGYTYTNANRRVLLRLMSSSDYDAGLGIGLSCTHCMYFMLEGVSAQPFLVMLIGSVKGLLLCYLFYFIGRVAERKKRQRMAYIVERSDLMDRLDAIKWIVEMRRVELRAERDTANASLSYLRQCAASLREGQRRAVNDGLFAMSTAELMSEKRHIRARIGRVEAAYYGKHDRASRLSRFLHRVVPNPIDLAIFLLLWALRFKKEEDVIRVRKVIAQTFSSATLSRMELAAHLGAVLSVSESDPSDTPTRTQSSPTPQPTAPLAEGLLSPTSRSPRDDADPRWYAFARYFAEHLTSDEHVWLVKHRLDTPPPLQSEKATILQEGDLRHTHLLLNATYLLYCALMDRVGSSAPGPHGHTIPSHRRSDLGEHRHTGATDNKGAEEATVSLDMAVSFLRQEVAAYAKEWVRLGCLNFQSNHHIGSSSSPVGAAVRGNPLPEAPKCAYGTVQDSDFSDVDGDVGQQVLSSGRNTVGQPERCLQFQMDTLLLLRAHTSDLSFYVEGEGEDAERHVTRVRFASRIEGSPTPAAQSDNEDDDDQSPNPNTEAPATSENFVKSVHIFQSKMRGDGGGPGEREPVDDVPPPIPTAEDTGADGKRSNSRFEGESIGCSGADMLGVPKVDLGMLCEVIAKERDSFFKSLSTPDIVLQMLRYSQEFNARIEERHAHFDYSKMYTQQLDEALAPNAFLILYGIANALFGVVVYIVEVLSKVSSEQQDKYTAFEVYQCIFFRFVNTTTFPTLLVDIFVRADQIARNPSRGGDEDGYFGRLLPLNLGAPRGKKRPRADRESRRTLAHRARSIASDKLLLLTLFLFSPPLITHIIPGCVLYAWLLVTPVALFFGLESWISSRLEAYDSSFAAPMSSSVQHVSNSSLDGSQLTAAVQVEDGATATDLFLPVMRSMDEEAAKLGMFARMRRSLDPTTTIFIVRSLLRVVLIFLLMAVVSASYTYMAVYAYADSPLVAQPPDTGLYGSLYGGVTTYERTGSYSKTSYLGAISTDYRGRSIDCIVETILTKFAVMLQTGLVSIF